MAKRGKAKPASGGAAQVGAQAPRIWERPWFPAAVFLLLSLAYFAEFVLSDKVVYGEDVGRDFHQGVGLSFWEKVQSVSQPMWNPQMGGFPQSEEIRPQYFPTYALYFFTTFQRHLGWRYILTMFLAGLGLYLYLRQVGAGRWAGLWAGVAYMSAPTFLSFPLAGHYAKMGVIALFPWMFFFLERGLKERRLIHFAALGICIALGIYSPHPQMLYYALLGTGLYFLFRVVQLYRQEAEGRTALGRSGLFALAVVLGLGLGAEGAFPLFVYTRTESKRAAGDEGGGKSAEEQLAFARSWSLHPEEAASLLIPEFGGFTDVDRGNFYWGRNPMKLNSEYFGVLVLLLALVAACEARKRPLVLFLGALFLLALAYTLGGHTPVHGLAFHLLPGVKVMRTIGMAAYLFAFAACALAGLGLQRVLESEAEQAMARRVLVVGGVLGGLALLVALAPGATTDAWIALFYPEITAQKQQILQAGYGWLARGALCVAGVAAAGTALLWLRTRGRLGTGLVVLGLGALTLLDTWRIDRVFLKYEDPDHYQDIRRENPRAVHFLQKDGELLRIFPVPDYNLLDQPGYHLYGIPVATGFNNLTIGRYDRLLREIEPINHLFSARYFRGQEVPYEDAQLLAAIHPLLNLLNARYLVAPRQIDLRAEAFPLVFETEKFRIYENAQALPWFYLAPSFRVLEDEERIVELLKSGQIDMQHQVLLEREPPAALRAAPAGDGEGDRIERLEYDPPAGYMRLRTQSDGPRLLVVSENFHSNWKAYVDGEESELYRAHYVWKAVYVPAGEHVVELRYSSGTLALSRAAVLAGLLAVLVIGGREARRRRREAGRGEPA